MLRGCSPLHSIVFAAMQHEGNPSLELHAYASLTGDGCVCACRDRDSAPHTTAKEEGNSSFAMHLSKHLVVVTNVVPDWLCSAQSVKWAEEVVDNEFLNKKSSKSALLSASCLRFA